MAEHDAAYFIDALKGLDWSHGYTGNQIINIFNNFPVEWFVHVPPGQTFARWEDFWCYVTPLSDSSLGPQVHEERANDYVHEADQRDAIDWGR